jgi:HEPN domain-containing protein/predicted nucleotidyltransferase
MYKTATGGNALRLLVASLVSALAPRRIILFGSRARGSANDDSDYDLLLEFDSPAAGRDQHTVAQRIARHHKMDVDFVIRGHGRFESRRNDPGFIDYDVAREGLVLYAAPGCDETQIRLAYGTAGVVVRETPAFESANVWMDYVEKDLLTINQLLASDDPVWSSICFHAQQAAEKAIKTVLIVNGLRPPRTHDLFELVELIRGTGYALRDLRRECELLEPHAVDSRYPGDAPLPTREDTYAVIDACNILVNISRTAVAERVANPVSTPARIAKDR